MKHINYLLIALFSLLLFSCANKSAVGRIVTVTLEPQRFFAEKIAGDKYQINCVVPSGQSPETYDPTPQQMMDISRSVAYLQIGHIGFEQVWMKTIRENNPQMEVFDLSHGMNLLKSADHHEHDHPHHGVDPHIWSSITGAKVIAANTLKAFQAIDPKNEAYYLANYNALMEEIEETEEAVNQLIKPLVSRTFIIYHPALTYLADEYRLTQLCIEMDGKEPSPAQLKELVETAKNYNTQVVFIQQEFDQKNAELIARETGCRLVRINPLAYDWKKEIIHIAKALADEQAD